MESDSIIQNLIESNDTEEFKFRDFGYTFEPLVAITNMRMLEQFKICLLTIGGCLIGVSFNEKDIITKIKTDSSITKIVTNHGIITDSTYIKQEEKIKSNKGRKPKEVIKKERKKQGDGTCFNSQMGLITNINNHEYNIMLFRTGVFSFPGITNPDLSEVSNLTNILLNYLNYNKDVREYFNSPRLCYYKINLLNIKTKFDINQDKYYIHFENLYKILKKEKDNIKYCTNIIYDNDKTCVNIYVLDEFQKQIYKTKDFDDGLMKKITEGNKKELKTSKIIFYSKGKINALGLKRIEFANEVFKSIDDILCNYKDKFIISIEDNRKKRISQICDNKVFRDSLDSLVVKNDKLMKLK